MAWILITIIIVLAITTLLHRLVSKNKNRRLQRPPGPRGFPILGHLHLLGNNPQRDLAKLANKHGPIMYMRFGFVPVIIVSSPQAAEQFLKKYDLVFASRPSIMEASKYLSYEKKNLLFASYGPYWRNVRKLCIVELFSKRKINSYQPMRKEEIGILVETLRKQAQDHVIIDLSTKISSLIADINCRMLFGKKYSDEELNQRGFKAIMKELMELVAALNLADYFPYLSKFDIQGLTRRLKAISKVFDAFFEKIIDEHEQPRNSVNTKDFVDTMLDIMNSGEANFNFDKRNIKAMLLDMLGASVDTSVSVIEWTMSELLKNPQVLKKVQKELEEVIGMDRTVEESDLDSLEYLNMVMKESFRLHPPGPLLIPHEAMEDCVVEGFSIQKKSRILINVWAIGRDPNTWSDPENFTPERFIGSNIDVRGRDFELIPFGSGRRSCPGLELGLTVVRIVIAQLAHCFDWKLPYDMKPKDLDMTEHYGAIVSRANNLMAIPSYRLNA